MLDDNRIFLRRQIIDWRDSQYETIFRTLNGELTVLFSRTDIIVESATLNDIMKVQKFFESRIEPIYLQWIAQEVERLVNNAQKELNKVKQHLLKHDNTAQKLQFNADNFVIKDFAMAAASTVAAGAAIRGTIAAAVTSAPAAGVLGWLGVTTTVISWPAVVVGGSIILGLSHFGIGKAGRLKKDAKKRIRDLAHETIRKRVIGISTNNSVCQSLQKTILDTSNALLKELKQ